MGKPKRQGISKKTTYSIRLDEDQIEILKSISATIPLIEEAKVLRAIIRIGMKIFQEEIQNGSIKIELLR